MRKFLMLTLAATLSLGLVSASPAQLLPPPPREPLPPTPPAEQPPTLQGFNTVLCVADGLLPGASLPDEIVLFGRQVILRGSNLIDRGDGLFEITVEVIHGTTSSVHTVRFIETTVPSRALNCGDTIISVS